MVSSAEKEAEVEILSSPDGREAATNIQTTVSANTGIADSTLDLTAEVTFLIVVDGKEWREEQIDGLDQDETITYDFSRSYEKADHTVKVQFTVDFYSNDLANWNKFEGNIGGIGGDYDLQASDSISFTIVAKTFTADGPDVDDIVAEGIGDSYTDAVDFEIRNITDGNTGALPDGGTIQFEYPNPAIGIDTGGNFVTHDIIGGATVRQRIGDQPLEISITGVATESTASQLERLRNVGNATLVSNRFSKGAVTVHVISVSTDPLDDGGAADLRSGQFLYKFTLECVEILNTGDPSGS